MKLYKTLITLLVFTFFASCDTIEGDYVEDNATFITDVVLFEFTGIHCPNCPDAHRIIDGLQDKFGTRFHTISLHEGGFAFPRSPEEPDFRTEDGKVIHDQVNTKKEYPSGSVMNLNEGATLSPTAWSTELGKYGWVRADVYIDIETEISGSELNAKVTLDFENDVEGDFNLCLFVVEDEVVGFQQDGGNKVDDYVHKHVFRKSMNGAWGVSIDHSAIYEKSFACEILSDWNTDQLHVIPFVYNTESMMVLPSIINVLN